jgi:hypothetical protein
MAGAIKKNYVHVYMRRGRREEEEEEAEDNGDRCTRF